MQTFRYAGATICYERLAYGATPIALASQADGIVVLVCRHREAPEESLHVLLEVQVCLDCSTVQRQESHDEGCLLCGGKLAWATKEPGRVTV